MRNLKMSDEIKNDSNNGHGGFEHQDLQVAGIVYFLIALLVVTGLCLVGIRGLYDFLDRRDKAEQPPVNPLITNAPMDTLHVASGYPQSAFPDPKLEEDERGQLNGILLKEENTLYSYGWIDQQAGTVRIPIDRAMELLAQRGLPVRPEGAVGQSPAAGAGMTKRGKTK
jgi:hypothetical protein